MQQRRAGYSNRKTRDHGGTVQGAVLVCDSDIRDPAISVLNAGPTVCRWGFAYSAQTCFYKPQESSSSSGRCSLCKGTRSVSISMVHSHPGKHVAGFNTPAWRNTIILGILATVAYKYAPEPGEENSVTKWIRESATTEERLLDVNAGHSAQQAQVSHINRVAAKARRPLVYRTQNPGCVSHFILEHFSQSSL